MIITFDSCALWMARSCALAMLCILASWRGAFDEFVARTWVFLQGNFFFRHESLEPMVASSSFAVWVALYTALDFWVPQLKRYRIQCGEASYQAELDW